VITRHARFASMVLAGAALVGCSQERGAETPDPQTIPQTILQAIPAADSAKYEHIRDMKKWQNPYLIVRTDGVTLYDSADSAEILLKTDELLPALAKLPASNWPYGRVVAAAESGTGSSETERIALRRNKGIVGGMLEGAHIVVTWVPSA
jgi:hypothetical protein